MEKLKFKLITRQLFLLLFDIVGITFTYWFISDALGLMPEGYDRPDLAGFALIVAVNIIIFIVCGMYSSLWEYGGEREILQVVVATGIATIFDLAMGEALGNRLRIHAYLFVWLMILFLCGGVRIGYRLVRGYRGRFFPSEPTPENRIMIIGAGYMGSMLLRRIQDGILNLGTPVIIIDDDPLKQRQLMHGVRVIGDTSTIADAAKKYNVNFIISAITEISRERHREIMQSCVSTGAKVMTTFDFASLIHDSSEELVLRNVEVEDLLNRKEVTLDTKAISNYVGNKVVLVSGGGGSIGSEICRQVGRFKPSRLIVFDIYENSAFELRNELRHILPNVVEVIVEIGSVRDRNRLEQIFEHYRPDVVYHAAAHKHVPLMERSPGESIKNNVFGTLNMVQIADKYKVDHFVMISTDKAVNPTNVMGATKRMAEMLVQSYSQTSYTKYAVVRFGNVLGSNGSVIPIFKRQIEKGGPVTVTHKDIIRYFMTIPEAARLVVQAGSMARGGEIYILEMGEPVKILSLAENLIRLSGYEPYTDIDIQFSGLRPGEKMYEELQMSDEETLKTENANIMVSESVIFPFDDIKDRLERLEACLDSDAVSIKLCLADVLPTYQPDLAAKF